ncbi:V-type proton ATPase subunit G [Tolypocladium ophioglossoides CBS 100239]|uniref:V-type proton ATPase subunit G n=1 Tax=Tolypocladium ophioglossoides (strain CBS 100239) TaxID=1163406 RepID=A0A0L0N0F9_TOLOC|nr:V-type proton ATPase subunit G [Tolypocladium ophioglossoides CBS 100239]
MVRRQRPSPAPQNANRTQSAQNSAGIQTLLDAEREASKIVQKAREFRTKRVKEARDEAKKEIAEYKASKDDDFKKFESEHSRGNKEAEDEASKEADSQIKTIRAAGQKGQAAVVKNLLGAVFEVNPVPPSEA